MEVKLSHKTWVKLDKDLSADEIISKIGVGELKAIAMRKKRAASKWTDFIWWEGKDKWFCNIAREDDTEWGWTTANNLTMKVESLQRSNYEFYIQG